MSLLADYKLVIKKLNEKDEIIGTKKLSIPKMLTCSSIVAIKAINKKLIFRLNLPNNPNKIDTKKLIINMVDVPSRDFFCLKINQLFEE